MSLPPPPVQRSLFDVENLLGRQFDPSDRFRLFRERVYPRLLAARKELEGCYCLDNGRRAEEPVVLLGATVVQFMERSPDRQAAECVCYHLGWKLALGLELEVGSFHPTTLCNFRDRLLAHEKARVAFDAVLGGLVEAGLVSRRSNQRLDSTHVLGLVARMSRLECVRETLRLALRELAEGMAAMKEAERPALPAGWAALWERYVQSKLDYRAEAPELAQKMDQAGRDAWEVLRWLEGLGQAPANGQPLAKGGKALLLARVFGENFELREPGRPGEAERVEQREAQPASAVKNPHDPEAQWSRKGKDKKDKKGRGKEGEAKGEGKGGLEWVGYKVQVAETVPEREEGREREEGEPTEAFLTSVETQEATASDEAGMRQVLEAQKESGLLDPPPELTVDAAYVSAAAIKEAREQGRELVGPAQPAANKGAGFKSEAFDVDVEGRKATCPAGHAATNCSRLEETATGRVSFRFEWGGKGGPCGSCPLRDKCLSPGQSHRTLTVGENHTLLQQRRREMGTEPFKQKMRRRNAIEGTISELARGHGLRRARSRGLKKLALQNHLIGAACNAKRWVRRAAWEIKKAAKETAKETAKAAKEAATAAARALAGAAPAAARA
jgi:hypothetical protein